MARKYPLDPVLEKQYDVRLLRDDFMDVYQGWCDTSAEFRRNADMDADLAYGDDDRHRLDIFRSNDPDGPVLVFIHGGYWQRGDKSAYSLVARPFIETGVNVALLGYPLCPDSSMSAIFQSIQRALLWLWRNAESHGLSAERINLAGHSAGGHLTAMALCTDWSALDPDAPDDIIRTGIPISGLYQLEPLRHTSISDALNLDDEEAGRLSPCLRQPLARAPMLVTLGGGETEQFHWQADTFLEQWGESTLTLGKHVEPDVDHFDIINRLADSGSEIFNYTLRWLK